MGSGVAVRQDAQGNMTPAKDRSTEKIDGIAASILGISRWIRQEKEEPSVYEERGIVTV